jgi:hypothetical protein
MFYSILIIIIYFLFFLKNYLKKNFHLKKTDINEEKVQYGRGNRKKKDVNYSDDFAD